MLSVVDAVVLDAVVDAVVLSVVLDVAVLDAVVLDAVVRLSMKCCYEREERTAGAKPHCTGTGVRVHCRGTRISLTQRLLGAECLALIRGKFNHRHSPRQHLRHAHLFPPLHRPPRRPWKVAALRRPPRPSMQ